MTAIHLSTLVSELSRPRSSAAYLLLAETDQKAAAMYLRVKDEILGRGITPGIIDFNMGLDALADPFTFSPMLLLLENAASIPDNQSEQLNDYVKQLTDHAAGSVLWYLGVHTLGRLGSGFSSRAINSFVTVTEITP